MFADDTKSIQSFDHELYNDNLLLEITEVEENNLAFGTNHLSSVGRLQQKL